MPPQPAAFDGERETRNIPHEKGGSAKRHRPIQQTIPASPDRAVPNLACHANRVGFAPGRGWSRDRSERRVCNGEFSSQPDPFASIYRAILPFGPPLLIAPCLIIGFGPVG
jgi:hypothetical protein